MTPLTLIFWLLAAATIGSLVFCGIALYGAVRFIHHRRQWARRGAPPAFTPPASPAVSMLKPLCGLDRELEENLRSFCAQDYPAYEILFSVRDESDPAAAVVRRIQTEFPHVPMRLLFTGPPRYLNAKVHALEAMTTAAAHDVLVITDSDVRVSPDYLRAVVAPLADDNVGPAVGMVTCISRGVAGRSLWSRLEALSMNTQFVPGVLSAWVLLGVQFALGPTMALRKNASGAFGNSGESGVSGGRLLAVGAHSFQELGDYLADDFVLGRWAAQSGRPVALAPHVPDHLVCNEQLNDSLRHRLRWERSSRRSRPGGYFGQVFMHPLPLGLLTLAAAPPDSFAVGAALLAAALAARYLLASVTCLGALRDPQFRRDWWLLPLQDVVSFGVWCWGFFGAEIEWRGARFRVQRGGKLQPVSPATAPARARGQRA